MFPLSAASRDTSSLGMGFLACSALKPGGGNGLEGDDVEVEVSVA